MPLAVREQILATASELFYRHGANSVGIDTVIAEAGVAKSSLYRHFPSKDDLIAAYLDAEDQAFWEQWDRVTATSPDDDPARQLSDLLMWIGGKIGAKTYRGCPQLHVVAEFPNPKHPARKVATRHKAEMRARLSALILELGCDRPEQRAMQLWLLIDGAFTNYGQVAKHDPVGLLIGAASAIVGVALPTSPSSRAKPPIKNSRSSKKEIGSSHVQL